MAPAPFRRALTYVQIWRLGPNPYNGARSRASLQLVGGLRCGDGTTHVVVVDDQIVVGGLRQQLRRGAAQPAGALVLAVHDDLAREPPVARGVERGALFDGGVTQPGRLVA